MNPRLGSRASQSFLSGLLLVGAGADLRAPAPPEGRVGGVTDESVALGVPLVLAGQVLDASGAPLAGAIVVSGAGGEAVTGADGGFALAIEAPLAAERVELTAVAGAGSRGLLATTTVDLRAAIGLTPVGTLRLAPAAGCEPGWVPTFDQGPNGNVNALAVFDDGDGPALYVGGAFTLVGGQAASRLARWDGSSWTPLGAGLDGEVLALTVHDDGSGPALYAGGFFTNAGGAAASHVARWDGSAWAPLGAGTNAAVRALVPFDAGSGPELIAAGDFSSAGSGAASHVARWNGSGWAALGAGTGPNVYTLCVHDDGSGPALYAGGLFTSAGGAPANRIARWDGASWTPLGSGLDAFVTTLAVFDDGSGPALYAGGAFQSAGGNPASRLARWNGTSWSALGAGSNGIVFDLTVFDDGRGPALYAGGAFSSVGGTAAQRIARLEGPDGAALGGGTNNWVLTLASFDRGDGPALFAGGVFTQAFDSGDSHLAKWDGCLKRLDFEREDDFTTPLANGQDLASPAEFGNLVSIRGAGANARAAIFDSTPGGPNAAGPDPDLLVASGNLLILQDDTDAAQSTPGFFDRPDDDPDGGMLRFVFRAPVGPRSVDLVDLDAGSGLTLLTQIDLHGRRRVHTIPANWTGDLLLGGAGRLTLDLTTLAAQPGFGSIATAVEDPGFEPGAVVTLEVRLGGSGALDNLAFGPARAPLGSGPRIGPR